MSLITTAEALGHLKLPSTMSSDPDLAIKMLAAEDVVLDWVSGYFTTTDPPIAPWTAATVPLLVKAAMLIQLGELWRFRGDDAQGQGAEQLDGYLSPAVTNLLRRYREPVLGRAPVTP